MTFMVKRGWHDGWFNFDAQRDQLGGWMYIGLTVFGWSFVVFDI